MRFLDGWPLRLDTFLRLDLHTFWFTFLPDIYSNAVVRFEHMEPWPNNPAAGKAGFALLFAFVHHWPGLPELVRSAT